MIENTLYDDDILCDIFCINDSTYDNLIKTIRRQTVIVEELIVDKWCNTTIDNKVWTAHYDPNQIFYQQEYRADSHEAGNFLLYHCIGAMIKIRLYENGIHYKKYNSRDTSFEEMCFDLLNALVSLLVRPLLCAHD